MSWPFLYIFERMQKGNFKLLYRGSIISFFKKKNTLSVNTHKGIGSLSRLLLKISLSKIYMWVIKHTLHQGIANSIYWNINDYRTKIGGLRGTLSLNLVSGPLCTDLFILDPKNHDIVTSAVTICVASWCLYESLQESRDEVMGSVLVNIKDSKAEIPFQSINKERRMWHQVQCCIWPWVSRQFMKQH